MFDSFNLYIDFNHIAVMHLCQITAHLFDNFSEQQKTPLSSEPICTFPKG